MVGFNPEPNYAFKVNSISKGWMSVFGLWNME